MRISTKCHLGVRVMLELAGLASAETITLRELAKRESTSDKYLWQVLNALTSSGLVRATRGVQGGYQLARPSHAINLKQIVFALDGPNRLVALEQPAIADRGVARVESEIWKQMEQAIVRHLEKSSLKELRERCETRNQATDYVI